MQLPTVSNNNLNRYPKAYETTNGLTSSFVFSCANGDPFYNDVTATFQIDWQSFMPTVGTFVSITIEPSFSNERPVIRANSTGNPTYLNYEGLGSCSVYFYMYDLNMASANGSNRYDYNLLNPSQLSDYANNDVGGGSSDNPVWLDLRSSVVSSNYSNGVMTNYRFDPLTLIIKMKDGASFPMPAGNFEVGAYVEYKSTSLLIEKERSTYSIIAGDSTDNVYSFSCLVDPDGADGNQGGGDGNGSGGGNEQ